MAVYERTWRRYTGHLTPLRGRFLVVTRYALPRGVAVLNAAREACESADLVLHSFLMTIAGHEVARERSIPDLSCQLFPFLPPSQAYPALGFPVLGLGPGYNLITHRLASGVFRDIRIYRFDSP